MDGICIKNDEFCIKNERFWSRAGAGGRAADRCIAVSKESDFRIKHEELCIENDEFCS